MSDGPGDGGRREPAGSSVPLDTEPPSRVQLVAIAHGLGPYITGRQVTRPVVSVVFWLVVLAVLTGIGTLVTGVGILNRTVSVWIIAGTLIPLIMIVRTLIAGFVSAYAFAGGLVHVWNGRVRVVDWATNLAAVRVIIENPRAIRAGRVAAYEVIPRKGSVIWILAELSDHDPLGAYLLDQARSRGVEIEEEVWGQRRSLFHPTQATRLNGFWVLALLMGVIGMSMLVSVLTSGSGTGPGEPSAGTATVCLTIAAFAYAIWVYVNRERRIKRPRGGPSESQAVKVAAGAAGIGVLLMVATIVLNTSGA